MSAPHLLKSVTLLLLVSTTGCSVHTSSHQREVSFAPTSAGSVLERSEELREISHRFGVEGASSDELRRALSAFEQLERVVSESERVDAIIGQARVMQFIAESQSDEQDIIRSCRRGERLAERVRSIASDRVEGFYFGAVFLGMRAQHQRVRAAMWLDDLEDLGRNAVDVDEGYDDAGPLRFLGMFLVSAPAWPLGPGDAEEGVELLQRAVELSDYPLNKLLLARGLVENGDEDGACQTLSEAFYAPQEGRWAVTSPRWWPEAEQLAAEISCQLQPPPGYASNQLQPLAPPAPSP